MRRMARLRLGSMPRPIFTHRSRPTRPAPPARSASPITAGTPGRIAVSLQLGPLLSPIKFRVSGNNLWLGRETFHECWPFLAYDMLVRTKSGERAPRGAGAAAGQTTCERSDRAASLIRVRACHPTEATHPGAPPPRGRPHPRTRRSTTASAASCSTHRVDVRSDARTAAKPRPGRPPAAPERPVHH